MRKYLGVLLIGLLLLTLMPVVGQQETLIAATKTTDAKPVGYYIIKLRYLTVGQVTAYFKPGGAYAQHIPVGVESIAFIPALQSIALKSANPEDVLTMTRLITQLDRPAKSYDISYTLVITNGTIPPLLPAHFATLPADDFTARIRLLVMRQQTNVVTYPSLHLDLNDRGEIVTQDNTTYYQTTPDSVVVLPSAYCPAAPAFRISHLPPAANAPTSGRFDIVGGPNDRTNFVLEKSETRNAVVFSYTGFINQETTPQRIFAIVTMSPR